MKSTLCWIFSLGFGATGVLGSNYLVSSATEWALCSNNRVNGSINIKDWEMEYDKSTRDLLLSVSGDSDKQVEVYGTIVVDFGTMLFTRTFDPCNIGMEEICPVPAASFGTVGYIPIPQRYASDVSSSITVELSLSAEPPPVESEFDLACVISTLREEEVLTTANKADIALPVSVAALLLAALAVLILRQQRARKAEEEISTCAEAELLMQDNERTFSELPPCGTMEMSGVGMPAEMENTTRYELEGDWHGYESAGVR